MPAKNIVKEYQSGGYYHIYNRGVEKRDIFLDEQDYKTFLSYLKFYLSPPLQGLTLKVKTPPSRQLRNHAETIDLFSYCLMPNHLHLGVQQHTQKAIASFMQSLGTKYSTYFNKKYDRVGSLFQGCYKAVRIKSEEQLIYLTKYIHLNPPNINNYPYSSYGNYLGKFNQTWINTSTILSRYPNNPHKRYQSFVEESDLNEKTTQSFSLD
ncbi:transposase [Patescibacteria group bacterium]|nr:transposase [Patescibacteria group bacterium]